MASHKLLVDIHTHVYLPRYAAFLRSRTSVPRIFSRTSPQGKLEDRLLILDNEPSGGRPIGAQVLGIMSLSQLLVLILEYTAVLGQRGETEVHG